MSQDDHRTDAELGRAEHRGGVLSVAAFFVGVVLVIIAGGEHPEVTGSGYPVFVYEAAQVLRWVAGALFLLGLWMEHKARQEQHIRQRERRAAAEAREQREE